MQNRFLVRNRGVRGQITDNKNRSVASIRTIFSKNGGNLGQTGTVGYMFDRKGMLIVELNGKDPEEAQLDLIECGAEDFDVADDELIVYTDPKQLHEIQTAITANGYMVKKNELTFVPNQETAISDPAQIQKIMDFIEKVEDDEDVQEVYCNADFVD